MSSIFIFFSGLPIAAYLWYWIFQEDKKIFKSVWFWFGMLTFASLSWIFVFNVVLQLLFNNELKEELKKKTRYKQCTSIFNIEKFYKNLKEFDI